MATDDNNDETGLTEVVVAQPSSADQSEVIAQLMQQIADLQVQIQRKQDLPNMSFSVNPPFHFPPQAWGQNTFRTCLRALLKILLSSI